MNLTRRHQSYLAVAGVCITALVLDKTLFAPGEASAEQSESVALTNDRTASDAALMAVPTLEPRGSALGTHLQAIAATHEISLDDAPNLFRAEWIEAGTESPAVDPTGNRERFMRAHDLSAVMQMGDGGFAIIDGARVSVGDIVDGFELTGVGSRKAMFRTASGTFEVPLQRRTSNPKR
jgi:hypothetical protein